MMTDFEPIPQSDLDEMQAREEAATVGPWEVEKNGLHIGVYPVFDFIKATYNPDNEKMRIEAQGTANFIAHARTDQPRLRIAYETALAEIERLRKGLREAKVSLHNNCTYGLTKHNARIDALLGEEGG